MTNRNVVMFKGNQEGISIVLDSTAHFDDIRSALKVKLAEAGRFFEGASSEVVVSGRFLSEGEEAELLGIFGQAGLEVSFNKPTMNESHFVKTEKQDEDELSLTEQLMRRFNGAEHSAKFISATLRSGAVVRYRGSVIVLGDVNPGAEILAEGNVIVLGSIKGLVQAGSMGDESCFIFALRLAPLQLRIAGRIYAPDTTDELIEIGQTPMRAYVEDKKMYIRPL